MFLFSMAAQHWPSSIVALFSCFYWNVHNESSSHTLPNAQAPPALALMLTHFHGYVFCIWKFCCQSNAYISLKLVCFCVTRQRYNLNSMVYSEEAGLLSGTIGNGTWGACIKISIEFMFR